MDLFNIQLVREIIKSSIPVGTSPDLIKVIDSLLDDYELATKKNEVLSEALQSLLNKVNRVTSSHRHIGCEVRDKDLTELSNRQIEVEKVLEENGR